MQHPSGSDRGTTASPAPRVYSRITAELLALGVGDLFGLVGEDTVALVADASAAGIRYLGARHESGVVAMADGYAWASGGVGVGTVTRGPGITNALNACRTAVQARRRVLVITGDVPNGGGGPVLKNIDQGPVCRSVGLEYFAARAVADVVPQFRRAAAAAQQGRPAGSLRPRVRCCSPGWGPAPRPAASCSSSWPAEPVR